MALTVTVVPQPLHPLQPLQRDSLIVMQTRTPPPWVVCKSELLDAFTWLLTRTPAETGSAVEPQLENESNHHDMVRFLFPKSEVRCEITIGA